MKIMFVDAQSVFRQGLKPLVREIDPDAEIIEADSFTSAIDGIREHGAPDLILLELVMPDMEGFEGLQAVVAHAPDTSIVVVSTVDAREDVLRAFEMGVHGYIPKSAEATEIHDALKVVIAGQVYLPPELLRNASRQPRPSVPVSVPNLSAVRRLRVLTDRERETAGLLGRGLTNVEIAEQLGLSASTVRLYVSNILNKLNLNNRTQIALFVRQASDEAWDDGDAPGT